MNGFDDRARAAGGRVRRRGRDLAASRSVDVRVGSGGRRDGRTRTRALAAVAAVVVVLAAVGWYMSTDGADEVMTADPADTQTTSSPLTTPAPTSPPSSAPSTEATSTTTTAEPTTTTVLEPQPVLRPYVDPAVCEPLAAREGSSSRIETLHPFARSSTLPISIQVIGDSDLDVDGPFALVLRYGADRPFAHRAGDDVEIDGRDVRVATYQNGNGEARWELEDGGEGYVRSRGVDREQLIGIVAALTETTADGLAPGFDVGVARPLPDGFEVLAEGTNAGLVAEGANLQCRAAVDGWIYRIAAFRGDPVFEYVAVLDRPVPADVGRRNGVVIVIEGPPPTESSLTVDDIGTADADTWAELLSRPWAWELVPPLPPTLSEMAAAGCASDPVPPHLLPDEAWIEVPEMWEHEDGGRAVRWGDDGSAQVTQLLPAQPLGELEPADVIEQARSDDRLISVVAQGGDDVVLHAAVVPIGDGAVGQIAVYIATPDGCVRHYLIGPGIELDDARDYVEVWLIVWGRGES